jgi:uncharacterized protein
MSVALVLTGGHSHPPEWSVPALRAVLRDAGFAEVDVDDDIERAATRLPVAPPDLLVVNALRWTMRHPRYAEHRDEWAYSPSESAREAITAAVRGGVPLLALHGALVSFDDWPEWGDLIGASWDWEASHHPPVGGVTVRCDDSHPVTAGLGTFAVDDECYSGLASRPDNRVVATAQAGGSPPEPACWLRDDRSARVATSTLGHDARSLDDPNHRRLLARLVAWLTGPRTTEEDAT